MHSTERLVSFSVVRVHDNSVVVDVCVLMSANTSETKRFRLTEGMRVNMDFSLSMRGDRVKSISPETYDILHKVAMP